MIVAFIAGCRRRGAPGSISQQIFRGQSGSRGTYLPTTAKFFRSLRALPLVNIFAATRVVTLSIGVEPNGSYRAGEEHNSTLRAFRSTLPLLSLLEAMIAGSSGRSTLSRRLLTFQGERWRNSAGVWMHRKFIPSKVLGCIECCIGHFDQQRR